MQTIAPAPAWHGATGEFIHNDDLLAAHNVVDVLGLQLLGLQGVDQVGSPLLTRVVQVRQLHDPLRVQSATSSRLPAHHLTDPFQHQAFPDNFIEVYLATNQRRLANDSAHHRIKGDMCAVVYTQLLCNYLQYGEEGGKDMGSDVEDQTWSTSSAAS